MMTNRFIKTAGLVLAAAGLVGLWAQLPVKLQDSQGTEKQLGANGAKYNSGLVAITTGGTVITTRTTLAKMIWCRNNTDSATSLTIADGSGNIYVPTNTSGMATRSATAIVNGDGGLTFTNGITITAGANNAVACQVEGAQ